MGDQLVKQHIFFGLMKEQMRGPWSLFLSPSENNSNMTWGWLGLDSGFEDLDSLGACWQDDLFGSGLPSQHAVTADLAVGVVYELSIPPDAPES